MFGRHIVFVHVECSRWALVSAILLNVQNTNIPPTANLMSVLTSWFDAHFVSMHCAQAELENHRSNFHGEGFVEMKTHHNSFAGPGHSDAEIIIM